MGSAVSKEEATRRKHLASPVLEKVTSRPRHVAEPDMSANTRRGFDTRLRLQNLNIQMPDAIAESIKDLAQHPEVQPKKVYNHEINKASIAERKWFKHGPGGRKPKVKVLFTYQQPWYWAQARGSSPGGDSENFRREVRT